MDDVASTGSGAVDRLGPVFLSYRQSDGTPTAIALAGALRAAGVPVWHDRTDLPPGDTRRRLAEALASGLSGAILIVTPEIALSEVVRDLELPALLDLARDPAFTLSIASTMGRVDDPERLDHGAPDRLLGTTEGTLGWINQSPVLTAPQRGAVAWGQARRRVEHLRPAIAAAGGELLLDLQTRARPDATRHAAHLVVRLRPPLDGQRLPSPTGLNDLREFLAQLPQLLAIGGATKLKVQGGAHLSIACALGAAVPTTLVGRVEVIDTEGASWLTTGQVPTPGAVPLLAAVGADEKHARTGPVLAYVDLVPHRSDGAFHRLEGAQFFAGVTHLRPIRDGLLGPADAVALVGEVNAALRALASQHDTTEVHLLLRCPYPVALLLGRSLNTLTVHLYEWDDRADDRGSPSYFPSLVLRSGAGGSPIHAVSAPADPTHDQES